ncbi:hypothetical protein BJY01DRAFT_154799 [Aspergillus pseudoustus]|uniref:Zn(2)-C6 fungal-type domain-containing protein n=1 Tax=Aspergillus pseudoustus TaxID=1810923 RepID=A0ABR4ICU2_9EURO
MLTLFGFQQKTYHPRRAHKKSRAGCLTCKKRRVKCDETHPTCRRCIRTGWSCTWPDVPSQAEDPSQTLQPATPRQDAPSTLSISFPIPSRIFQTQRETHFFDFFRLHTVTNLSVWSPSSFWQRLVLQMAHSEPAARRAAIALGALHAEGSATDPALRCYGEALATLRGLLVESGSGSVSATNVDVCLTTCLLLSCFEIARKDYVAARIHYARGLEILKLCDNNESSSGVRDQGYLTSISEEPLQTTFSLLETHIIAFLSNRPSPGYVHDPVYSTPSATASPSSSSSFSSPTTFLTDLTLSIPCIFPSLSTATESFLRIQHAIQSAITRVSYQLAFAQAIPIPDHEGIYPHREAYGASVEFPGELEGVLREGLALARVWEAAFEGFVQGVHDASEASGAMGGEMELGDRDGTTRNGSGRSFRDERLITLLRGLAGILTIRCSRDPALGEMGYDIFRAEYDSALAHFERAVELAWAEKETSGGNGGSAQPLFSLGLGVLHGLYDLVAKCRDLGIRQRGLDVLARMPFREGLWDGPNAHRVVEAIVGFEEGNRIPGLDVPEGIPNEYRLVGVNFMFSPGRFKIIADSIEGRGFCSVELD